MGATRVDIERLERRLNEERASLVAELPRVGQIVEMFPRTEVMDPEDLSVHLSDRDVTLDIIARKSSRLALVDGALSRMAAGAFGACTGCDEPITPARLEADPAVALCVSCQQSVEDRRALRFPEM
jgi:DnaK suppressor protein